MPDRSTPAFRIELGHILDRGGARFCHNGSVGSVQSRRAEERLLIQMVSAELTIQTAGHHARVALVCHEQQTRSQQSRRSLGFRNLEWNLRIPLGKGGISQHLKTAEISSGGRRAIAVCYRIAL
jgi:hypothetical protein